jgi:hypothetical protein
MIKRILLNSLKIFVGTILFWFYIWGPYFIMFWTGDMLDFIACCLYGITATVGYLLIELIYIVGTGVFRRIKTNR